MTNPNQSPIQDIQTTLDIAARTDAADKIRKFHDDEPLSKPVMEIETEAENGSSLRMTANNQDLNDVVAFQRQWSKHYPDDKQVDVTYTRRFVKGSGKLHDMDMDDHGHRMSVKRTVRNLKTGELTEGPVTELFDKGAESAKAVVDPQISRMLGNAVLKNIDKKIRVLDDFASHIPRS